MKVTDKKSNTDTSWNNGSLEYYKTLFNTVSEGVCIHRVVYDQSGAAVDYEVIDVNAAYEKITGISKEDALGKLGSALYGTDEAPFLDIYAKTAETGEPAGFEIFWPPMEKYFNVSVFSPGKGTFGTVFLDITEQKNTLKALEASEDRHRTLVSNYPNGGVYLFDFDLKYLIADGKGLKKVGLAGSEMIGKSIWELFSKDTCDAIAPLYRSALDGKETMRELWFRNHCYLTYTLPVRSPDGSVVAGMAITQDITERQTAENALKMERERFYELLDNLPGLVFLQKPDNTIFFANKHFRDLFGDPRNRKCHEIVHHRHLPCDSCPTLKVLETGQMHESDMVTPDGRIFHVYDYPYTDVDGSPMVIEMGVEITELKKIEEKLRENEERYHGLYIESKRSEQLYRSLLSSSADAIVVYDLEGNVRHLSRSFTEKFGWTLEEITGQKLPFMPDSEKEKTLAEINRVLQGKNSQNFETVRYTKDGALLNVNISSSRYEDHNGKPAGILVILRDVTETKILEAQLIQAQKMEAVGTLAGGVAHDFNNLLQAIQGYSEILLLDLPKEHLGIDNVRAIKSAAQRAANLTRQLLTFSRRVESRLRPTDLNGLVHQVKGLLHSTIPKMIGIELYLREDLKKVNADATQIEQVLMNLALNARDAMPDGGRLTLESDNVYLDQLYQRSHLGAQPGEYVLLSVSDNGIGMDPDTVEHIFEPFYTTKGVGKGTGLGLAMVYGIIKSHGGYIMCYSEPDRGTTFRIYLPVAHQELPKQADQEVSSAVCDGREHILVVDDEEWIRDLASQMLTRCGYRVSVAVDGESALELYRSNSDEIDLVVLDLGMPGIGGQKCFMELQRINPSVKVLIASGYAPNGQAKNTIRSGASGFIGKPYNLGDLTRTVRSILDATS